eukprot:g3664.t1
MGLLDSDSDSDDGRADVVGLGRLASRLAARLSDGVGVGIGGGGGSMYASREYWEKRLALGAGAPREGSGGGTTLATEWYLAWDQLRDHVLPLLRPAGSPPSTGMSGAQLLSVGCGVSGVEDAVARECPGMGVTAIDFAGSCFKARGAAARARMRPRAPCPAVMDARRMALRGSSFDVVLDKGTLDALMAGGAAAGARNAAALLREAARVLAPGGAYIVVSHSAPWERCLPHVYDARQAFTPKAEPVLWRVERATPIEKGVRVVWLCVLRHF